MSKTENVQSIKLRTAIDKLVIKFICPICNENDKVLMFNPIFHTDYILSAVRNKVGLMGERTCRFCYSEMDIKHIRCEL